MKSWVAGTVALSLLFAGCASMGPKEGAGSVIGGVGGAVIGSQFGGGTGRVVGTAIGAVAGVLIGQEIGKSLDRADQLEMQRTAQYALENNRVDEPRSWRNPDSGNSGTVTPKRTYKTERGQYCREYQQTVLIGGEERQAYGTACRQPDGTWKIVK
ncbi:MAG: glycine zipper 2TM domain-containing protein [Deltaproteobacteria bacterium]|nr:glycine zipper 2TM domain-containing protein [Deltaproteobacteria bacterium]